MYTFRKASWQADRPCCGFCYQPDTACGGWCKDEQCHLPAGQPAECYFTGCRLIRERWSFIRSRRCNIRQWRHRWRHRFSYPETALSDGIKPMVTGNASIRYATACNEKQGTLTSILDLKNGLLQQVLPMPIMMIFGQVLTGIPISSTRLPGIC